MYVLGTVPGMQQQQQQWQCGGTGLRVLYHTEEIHVHEQILLESLKYEQDSAGVAPAAAAAAAVFSMYQAETSSRKLELCMYTLLEHERQDNHHAHHQQQ